MAYGQYSAGGGLNRTKVEMIATFKAQGYRIDPAQARKGGKNRLHFVDSVSLSEHFTLHETVVANLNASRTRLALADGGWHTPTTQTAWKDAVKAFKLTTPKAFYETEYGDDMQDGVKGRFYASRLDTPLKTERSVTYIVQDNIITGRDADAPKDHPLIRADVENDGNFAVRYDGTHIVSDAGAKVRATPFKVLTVLYRIDKLARATKNYHCMRGDALWQFTFEAMGFTINPGQSARAMMIGCHTFKTQEIRATCKQIETLYPQAVLPAKRFVKRNPLDYGIPAYEEARRAEHQRRFG